MVLERGRLRRWRDGRRVLRVGRMEVLDPSGRVRVVVGDVAGTFGVFLLDATQEGRASFATYPEGVSVSFTHQGGNDAAVLGVLDGLNDPDGEASAYAVLVDRKGRRRFGARAWREGAVERFGRRFRP